MTHADTATGWPTEPPAHDQPARAAPAHTNGHNPPPRDLDAERAVLGACLVGGRPTVTEARALIRTSDDFYLPRHQLIWQQICTLADDNVTPDLITVPQSAARTGGRWSEDDRLYLVDLYEQAPMVLQVTYHARTVAEQSALRRIDLGALRLQQAARQAGSTLTDPTRRAELLDQIRHGVDALAGERAVTATRPAAVELDQFLEDDDDKLEYDWVIPDVLERGDRVILTGQEGYGKALACTTPILTDRGWVTMADVKVGDRVWHPSGVMTDVAAVTDVMHDRPCYTVIFDDGAAITADAQHLWRTETLKARETIAANARRGPTKPRGTDQRCKQAHHPAVVTTEQIAATLHARGGHCLNHAIPTTAPLAGVHAQLPIDPYVLGAWLGDGHTDQARLTCADPEIVDEIRRAGEPCRPGAGRYLWQLSDGIRRGRSHGHGTLQARLRALGVLGHKHIPAAYLDASYAQRMALLQGLMDTDGTVNAGATCEFSVTDEPLAAGVLELLRTLGIKASMKSGPAKLKGRTVGTRWRLAFHTDLPVFRLPRKAERLSKRPTRRGVLRYITNVQPVTPVPVRCIQVAAPDGMYLAGHDLIPTHNSTLLRQLAVQVAAGIHPFTGSQIPPQRVLYVDLENSRRQIRRKLGAVRIAAGSHYKPTPGLHMHARPEGLDLLDPDDARYLTELVTDVDPDILIIGPIYKLVGGDPKEEAPARVASRLLDRLRTDVGFALLMEAHSPLGVNGGKRPERPYGASLWLRWPEFGLYLSPEGYLRHWRGDRDERMWPAAMKRGGEWPFTSVTKESDLAWVRIVELCREMGDQPDQRSLAKLVGKSQATVSRLIREHRTEWDSLSADLAPATDGDGLGDAGADLFGDQDVL